MEELQPEQDLQAERPLKRHIIIMVNGLFGNPANWDAIKEALEKVVDMQQTLLVVSHANSLRQTFDGIDTCGQRLCDEIRQEVARYPHLERISFIGHSMGGLLCRYAVGKLYDEETGLVAGLRPTHFITMATPHLGCEAVQGPAQVPFIGWTAAVPVVGSTINWALQSIAKPVASTFLLNSGKQFFLEDATDSGQEPLLVRMSKDGPEGPFWSALASFATRTCYANTACDHLAPSRIASH
eukprot:jgi/Astpho2/4532/Aster-00121